MPTRVELAQWAESAGYERAFLGWRVGPRMARALPTCYGARRESALIEIWVHRSRLLWQQVGGTTSWVVDKRGHRRSRGHRQKNLSSGRLVGSLEKIVIRDRGELPRGG